MKTLATLLSLRSRAPAVTAIALVMAFAFGGPVVFTATPADAGDRWHCWGAITGYSQCEDEGASNELLDDLKFITPAHAGDSCGTFTGCPIFIEDDAPRAPRGLLGEME
ncbi:MAG: hypothetical protein V6Z81_07655 [Parvularculales bacterium]